MHPKLFFRTFLLGIPALLAFGYYLTTIMPLRASLGGS